MKTSNIALALVALITTTLVGGCISVHKDETPSTTSTTTRTTEVTPAYVAPSTTTVQRTTY